MKTTLRLPRTSRGEPLCATASSANQRPVSTDPLPILRFWSIAAPLAEPSPPHGGGISPRGAPRNSLSTAHDRAFTKEWVTSARSPNATCGAMSVNRVLGYCRPVINIAENPARVANGTENRPSA
jgi:hypothetical protein